jgi:hypothetical protein
MTVIKINAISVPADSGDEITAQRNGLRMLGVGDDRIYVDHGVTGTNRDRSGLGLALASCPADDTLVVTSRTGSPDRFLMPVTFSTS